MRKLLVHESAFIMIWAFLGGSVICKKPSVVNVGVIFSFDSVIGRASKLALEAAAEDVNADPSILNGTELKLIMHDSSCNPFLGSIEVFQALENEIVAIVGPQSSNVAHIISHIASSLQVPLVSYASTDPTLSSLQFPFFLRTTQTDSYQMAAMADLIDFYNWKEIIAVFIDDDYGRNGISSLEDELLKKMSRISYKLPLPSQFDINEVTKLLNSSKLFGPRVYVVHINPDPELRILTIAYNLGMMRSDYVWLSTDWLSVTIDSFSEMKRQTSMSIIQGVVGFRHHIPESNRKNDLWARLNKKRQEGLLNSYALYAYDTIWVVANSIDKFIKIHGGNISFSLTDKLPDSNGSGIDLGKLKVFNDGALLLRILLETNFKGLTGQIRFNADRNILSGSYEVINFAGMGISTVGYWSNFSGFTILPPENLGEKENSSNLLFDQKLENVTWAGGNTERPRGWVVADDEKPLRIGVPNRASFVEFVTKINNTGKMEGYTVDIFTQALKLVPYNVPYRLVSFGNGLSNPSYAQLVGNVADGMFDAAIGDIAIVTNRTKVVDFSQPFVSTGLVIVAPIKKSKSSAWVFLKPFTVELWCVTAAAFVMIGTVIWILEHRVNEDFRGPPRHQIATIFLFSFSTLFKTNQEKMVSTLGRMVMMIWLFLLMVITSSYTASLTSILTVQQLSSSITGIDELIATNSPIGYQVGSFAYSYLTEGLFIPGSRLVSLGTPEEYERALQLGPAAPGGVAAIIDELPYVELFLSRTTDFRIVGQPFTKSGWGFAFQKESPLAIDISTAILKLSENGDLQKIHKKWFCKMNCPGEREKNSKPNQLHLISFWGLYLLCGISSLLALFIFLVRMVRQYIRYKRKQMDPNSSSSLSATSFSISSNASCSHVIQNFIDFVDEKEESIKKIFGTSEVAPHVQAS